MILIAALFVERPGVYCIPHVDAWDVFRDARTYAGRLPVVAHPPCERWGRYWGGGPMLHGTPKQKILGDDGGCFEAALAAVNRCGGVLEHPEATHAFRVYGLARPPKSGGWIQSGIGWTCCVEQGHYGHRARKATWLYYVGYRNPPNLIWGKSYGKIRLEQGKSFTGQVRPKHQIISAIERKATPIPFRDLLLNMAYLSRYSPSG